MNSKRIAAIALLSLALLIFISISAVHADYAYYLAGLACLLVAVATVLALLDRGSNFSLRDGTAVVVTILGLLITINSFVTRASVRMIVMASLVATVGSAQLVMD
jgi:hypothetical protein